MESPSAASIAFDSELEDVSPLSERIADEKEIGLESIEDQTAEPVKRDRKGPPAANLPQEVIEQ